MPLSHRDGRKSVDEDLMAGQDVMRYLGCGRTFLYKKLRHLALDVSPDSARPMLRWRRGALDAFARPVAPQACGPSQRTDE